MSEQEIKPAESAPVPGDSLRKETVDRSRLIVRTSFVGIAANIFLAAMKAVIGLLTRSIAITLDAVNNLTDALSSVITIFGTKLAGKRPDRDHPLGHGRIEYLSAMLVSALVLYAGITALVESVKKIISPEKADYSMLSLAIIAVAIAVKLILGRYVRRQGIRANSGALIASGQDALFDAFLSLSVLASAVIFMVSGLSLEAYVGVLISIFILRSGVEMMRETLSDILGKRADPETTARIRELILEFPEVRGVYDLFINNYGPDRNYASVHLELPDVMTVEEVDVLTRKVQMAVFRETGVILTGVGVYSYNTKNEEAAKIRNDVQHLVMGHPWALQMHAFFVDIPNRTMRFDVVLSFEITSKEALAVLDEEMRKAYPGYTVIITPDVDVSDV